MAVACSKAEQSGAGAKGAVAACGNLAAAGRCFVASALPTEVHAQLCVVPDVPSDIVEAYASRQSPPGSGSFGVAAVPGTERLLAAAQCMALRCGPAGALGNHLQALCDAVDDSLLVGRGLMAEASPSTVCEYPVLSADAAPDAVVQAAVASAKILCASLALCRLRTSTTCGDGVSRTRSRELAAVVERVVLCRAIVAKFAAPNSPPSVAAAVSTTVEDVLARAAVTLRGTPLQLVRVAARVTPHLRPDGRLGCPTSTNLLAALLRFALLSTPAGAAPDASSFFECVARRVMVAVRRL